jgi:hypothetical protein
MKFSNILPLLIVALTGCAADGLDEANSETEDADLGAMQNPFIECSFIKGTEEAKVSFAKNKPRSWKGTVLGAQFEVGMSSNHLQTVTLSADGKRQITHSSALYPKEAAAAIASATRGDVSVRCVNGAVETFPKDNTWKGEGVYAKAPNRAVSNASEGYVFCSASADVGGSDTTDV